MLETLEVVQSPEHTTAIIRFNIPQMVLPEVMPGAVHELLATLKDQGITPAGPLFNRYLSMDSGRFDFETGFPVSSAVSPTGRVVPGFLPATRVAQVIYQGPYSELHHAWHRFSELVRTLGHQPSGGFWESYLVGPETTSDHSAWRTELNQPLA